MRVPFARYFKRLTIGRAIGIIALVGIGYGINTVVWWCGLNSHRTELAHRVYTHKAESEIHLAELAYQIAQPMLDDYDRGNIEQRLAYTRRPDVGLFVMAKDSPLEIVRSLLATLEHRAVEQMDAAGLNWDDPRQRFGYLGRVPAYQRVDRISSHLQELSSVAYYANQAADMDEVQEVTARIGVLELATARLLQTKPNTGTEG